MLKFRYVLKKDRKKYDKVKWKEIKDVMNVFLCNISGITPHLEIWVNNQEDAQRLNLKDIENFSIWDM